MNEEFENLRMKCLLEARKLTEDMLSSIEKTQDPKKLEEMCKMMERVSEIEKLLMLPLPGPNKKP